MHKHGLTTKTIAALALVLGLVSALSGCDTHSPYTPAEKPGLSAEAAPEGILLKFDAIPPGITRVFINFIDFGEAEEMAQIKDIRSIYADIRDDALDELRTNGTLICPFVRNGHSYDIAILYEKERNSVPEEWLFTQCVAGNGVHPNGEVELRLNETATAVALSSEPEFSEAPRFAQDKYRYGVTIKKGEYWSIGVGDDARDDSLIWEFEPTVTKEIAESGYLENGSYPAFATVYCNAVYGNVTWSIELAKTEEFTVTF